MFMTSVVVMAGGKGTRIRPLTFSRPKPLVPVANRPILDYIIQRVLDSGYRKVVMTLGYLKDQIKSHVLEGYTGIDFKFSVEKEPLGTAGGVKAAFSEIDETFIVLSGDVLFDLNLREMVRFHRKKNALVTVALTPVEDPSHYGIAVLDDDGRINRFHEKPRPEEVFSKIANAGIYVMEPEVLEYIPRGNSDFSADIFPFLIEKDAGMYGFLFDGYWNDVGKPNTFLRANHDALNGTVMPEPEGEIIDEVPGRFGKIWVGRDVFIGERARIVGPAVIGDGSRIGNGAYIGRNTVIGAKVNVGENSFIRGSVILDGCAIGRGSQLLNCVVDEECEIGARCAIDRCAIIGCGAFIGPSTVIRSNCTVSNDLRILSGSLVDSDYPLVPW
ncbi:hypothetical protein DNK57_02125 [Methanothermobacter thermautotrophicus]|uniref:Bifunctional protein GlmU n=2 Tax=Methanothermobacter thermautotrophicus TaxID=145262 RepID=A0A842YL84_METTF|nr:hypothetical protein [Methanothermobacter thermautotrophicus]